MEITANLKWPGALSDPSGRRPGKPRSEGITMVIDKGLGLHAFEDLMAASGEYIDIVKLGFGTSPLYPAEMLERKIDTAKRNRITVIPGGTLLEAAVTRDVVPAFFRQVLAFGFDGIEVSDGTIELPRERRDELIRDASGLGLRVFTEYGKKILGSRIDVTAFAETAERDFLAGAELVTVEARESGIGVGLFDERGTCREQTLAEMLRVVPNRKRILWEAPLKEQQVALIKSIGPEVNLGNIPVQDVMALETMRRGLRSDTFELNGAFSDYFI
ncbi:phosphosulfolactate synthase [Cohnella sp. CFH 77786]|uniref:phosphosulfolactate synthase n=1 Tax=Cohnella sp. CFH 77786 TaxID=2662265 RepID=UPI001C60D0DB|nr:phosphosulfolactate synthase [Cohnella sp. CFH 77786]MBW5446787.1 phosphosulfolactate synthase [Cohnella sp. CFH 77786]